MTNTMIGYPGDSWEEEPRLGGERFNQPMPWSREGRQIAMANRQAQVDAVTLANRAAIQNLKNALNHGLKETEAGRRADRLHSAQHRAAAAMDEVAMISRGNPNREAVHMQLFNAWHTNEVFRQMTDGDGSMR